MKRLKEISALLITAFTLVTGASECRRHPETHTDVKVAASMDDSTLTVSDIEALMPAGLSQADSLALAQAIVEGWVEDRLFETYLQADPAEQQRIDRMVEDYRRRLRMEAYRSRMRQLHEPPVKADSVRAYYDRHKADLICEHPLAKGLLLKVPSNSPALPRLRQWSKSAAASDLGMIEKETGSADFIYEYFGDTWVEFDIIASEIPYGFGNADTFLKSNKFFETESGGYVYLLHIYDQIPSGSLMPYEFAEMQIRDILQESRLEAYRRGLIRALREKAVRDGRLKLPSSAGARNIKKE